MHSIASYSFNLYSKVIIRTEGHGPGDKDNLSVVWHWGSEMDSTRLSWSPASNISSRESAHVVTGTQWLQQADATSDEIHGSSMLECLGMRRCIGCALEQACSHRRHAHAQSEVRPVHHAMVRPRMTTLGSTAYAAYDMLEQSVVFTRFTHLPALPGSPPHTND